MKFWLKDVEIMRVTPDRQSFGFHSLFAVVLAALLAATACGGVTSSSETQPPPASLRLSASPTSISFGSVTVGSTATQQAVLTNTGTSDVVVSAANVTGMGFSVSGVSFPVTVAPGASRSVDVKFTPEVTGPANGSVTFVSNAENSPATVSLSGSGSQASSHTVELQWDPSASVVNGYNVYRGSQSGGPYSRINSLLEPSTSYFDSGVASGSTYYYVVKAVNSSGTESVPSNEAAAAIP